MIVEQVDTSIIASLLNRRFLAKVVSTRSIPGMMTDPGGSLFALPDGRTEQPAPLAE